MPGPDTRGGSKVDWLAALLTILLSLSCDESLPPRDEPRDFLQAEFDVIEATVLIRGGVVQETAGSFFIRVKNVFDEVLHGEERIRAEVEVEMVDIPGEGVTVIANKSNLMNSSIVTANMVTLQPNVSANVLKQWTHRNSEGRGFWEFVRLTPRVTQLGEPYLESDPVLYTATGRVQVFRNVQPIKLRQLSFALVYYIFP